MHGKLEIKLFNQTVTIAKSLGKKAKNHESLRVKENIHERMSPKQFQEEADSWR